MASFAAPYKGSQWTQTCLCGSALSNHSSLQGLI